MATEPLNKASNAHIPNLSLKDDEVLESGAGEAVGLIRSLTLPLESTSREGGAAGGQGGLTRRKKEGIIY
jgi:hypothetical protein